MNAEEVSGIGRKEEEKVKNQIFMMEGMVAEELKSG